MEKKHSKMLYTAMILFAAVFNFNLSYAQIVYSNKGLNIGNAAYHPFLELTVNKYLGMYWTCKGSNFFQLDISPKNPRIAGTGDGIVFYNSQTNTFNSIQVANVYQYSDARAKTNIKDISMGLNTIARLRPVSYNWKTPDVKAMQVVKTKAMGTATYGPEDSQLQYGFLAQEVEQILPDAVKTDEEGHKMINYTALIPLLVQSVQDLKAQVEDQQALISELLNRDVTVTGMSSIANTVNTNRILNYSPNPTDGIITFTVNKADLAAEASLVICNLSGVKEKMVEIPSTESTIQVDMTSLNPGLHIASLIVGGKVFDSKQVVKN